MLQERKSRILEKVSKKDVATYFAKWFSANWKILKEDDERCVSVKDGTIVLPIGEIFDIWVVNTFEK